MVSTSFQTGNLAGRFFAIAGIPFANKKIQINATASTEVQAATRNMIFITFSLIDFIKSVPFYLGSFSSLQVQIIIFARSSHVVMLPV